MPKKPILITVVGPTAIGKTALSIQLAQHFSCPILSCDSRQFFKEMTIGTAVPSVSELLSAKHYFIQNISIHDPYSVGMFEKEAIAKLNELFKENDYVVMVGGSGLYMDAVVKGLDLFPEINPLVRTQLLNDYEKNGLAYLQENLKKLDIAYYQKLALENPQTLQNPQRLLRFLEVCLGTSKPYSSFLNKNNISRSFSVVSIGLEADRNVIYNRIDHRVDLMIDAGLVDEVKKLQEFSHLNALQTVGYKEIFEFLNGKITLEFAIDEIKKNTRRFAKRQLTWFKRNDQTKWFDFDTDFKNIITFIENCKMN